MKKFFSLKSKLLISLLAVALVVGVGTTIAYLQATTGLLKNTFAMAEVDTEISENITDGNKTVKIENKGDSAVYVRARVLVSGVNPKNVAISSVEKTDIGEDEVILVMPNNQGWDTVSVENLYDGSFIYYTPKLESGASSNPLLQKVQVGSGVDLNTFSVTITHESVLASGYDTPKDAFEAAENKT